MDQCADNISHNEHDLQNSNRCVEEQVARDNFGKHDLQNCDKHAEESRRPPEGVTSPQLHLRYCHCFAKIVTSMQRNRGAPQRELLRRDYIYVIVTVLQRL